MDAYEQLGVVLEQANRDYKEGKCRHLSPSIIASIVSVLSGIISPETPLNREQASLYFHLSTRQFDRYVALGKIPKDKKIAGFTERVWYRSELSQITL